MENILPADCWLSAPDNTRNHAVWSWVIPVCPICGKRHTHGGGDYWDDDPTRYLGDRVPHCRKNPQGYTIRLRDESPHRTRELIAMRNQLTRPF